MPRIQRGILRPTMSSRYQDLMLELMAELKNSRPSGQPRIDEHRYPKTGMIRVIVLWDKWRDVPEYERIAVIQTAYEKVESPEFFDHLVMVMGLTFPEAYSDGLLPFQVIASVRSGDPVSLEDCQKVMLQEGGSTLFRPDSVELRFATEEEAIECKERLSLALPGSENVWMVIQSLVRPMEPALDG